MNASSHRDDRTKQESEKEEGGKNAISRSTKALQDSGEMIMMPPSYSGTYTDSRAHLLGKKEGKKLIDREMQSFFHLFFSFNPADPRGIT